MTTDGRYNNIDMTIRITNISPKWKNSLGWANGNIYKLDSWEEMVVNIVVSGIMSHTTYNNVDGKNTPIKSYESLTTWNERGSRWCNRATRRQIRRFINDSDYTGHYDNTKWDKGISIKKLLQLYGIPYSSYIIGTIRFED